MESTTMQQSPQPVVTGRTMRYQPMNLARWIIWSATALVMLVMPLIFTGGFAVTLMSQMGIMIIFALSYNMLLGQTGMLSFGHAVYSGLGAFIAVHVLNMVGAGKVWLPVSMLPLVGGLAGAFFGVVFGYVTTKKSGTTFAMITMGIGEMVFASSLMFPDFFGGEGGISTNRVVGDPFLGITFGPGRQVYYLIAIWCFLSMVAMYAWTQTPLGRIANAVRDNPERAEFVGYSTQRVRFQAFTLSAMFAGVAGALAAINFELMNSQAIGAGTSGQVLLMTFVGGIGHFFGPILGAMLITFLQISLSDITKAWMLYFGLLFILVVMFAPGGIAGFLSLHQPLLRNGRIFKLVPSYLMASVPLVALVLGMISLIEMAHHMLVEAASDGAKMHLFKIAFDAATPIPWIVALALFFGGALGLKLVWPRIDDAWGQAQAEGKQA